MSMCQYINHHAIRYVKMMPKVFSEDTNVESGKYSPGMYVFKVNYITASRYSYSHEVS